jgi:hypothetical protein
MDILSWKQSKQNSLAHDNGNNAENEFILPMTTLFSGIEQTRKQNQARQATKTNQASKN